MKNILITLFFCAVGISCLFAETKTVSCISKFSESVRYVAWSADGEYFAVSAGDSIVLFDANTNGIIKLYMGKDSETIFTKVKLSDDGKFLLGIRADGKVFVWNVDDDSQVDEISLTAVGIKDAVFLENGYRIAVLGEDNTIYEWFKLLETNVCLLNKRFSSASKIDFLSISAGKKLFSPLQDGSVLCVDTKNWSSFILRSLRLTSSMPLEFNAEKTEFLGKVSKTELAVVDTEGKKIASIFDGNEFLDTAVFVAGQKSIAAGTKKSQVKMYSIEKNGKAENTLLLVKGDNAMCIASGVNGDIVVGTEQGYLMRMRSDGRVYSSDTKEYVSQDNKSEEEKAGKDKLGQKGSAFDFLFSYETLPKNYYIGSLGLEVVYRNRNSLENIVKGAYWGGAAAAEVGIPKVDFPYNYSVNGQNMYPPYLYALSLVFLAGYERAIMDSDFRLFAEVRSGGGIRILYNNSMKYAHAGGVFSNFLGEAVLGVRWNILVLSFAAAYDSNLGLLNRIALGVSIGK